MIWFVPHEARAALRCATRPAALGAAEMNGLAYITKVLAHSRECVASREEIEAMEAVIRAIQHQDDSKSGSWPSIEVNTSLPGLHRPSPCPNDADPVIATQPDLRGVGETDTTALCDAVSPQCYTLPNSINQLIPEKWRKEVSHES